MPKTSCVHYTGKKLCMIGNSCEGDMPCYERYVATRNTASPDKKLRVTNKIMCPYCKEWFFGQRKESKYCSRSCAMKRRRELEKCLN